MAEVFGNIPVSEYREDSIGIPFPDMLDKIAKPGTTEEGNLDERA